MSENYPLIFVNYALSDNKPENKQPGWVESFSYVLKLLTAQITKSEIKVILREDLDNDGLDDKFIKTISAFINVYSHDFDKDEKAKKNWEIFSAGGKTGIPVFTVLRSTLMDNSFGDNIYEFHSEDTDESDSESDLQQSKDYWLKIVDMSYDLSKSFRKEKEKHSKTVFIAETTPEQKAIRDAIKRDLKQHGYKTLPDKPLPLSKDLLEKAILENVSNSNMTIHILGEKYGDKKVLKNMSVVDYQNKVAAEYCQKNPGKLNRIIWLSPEHRNTDLEQSEYLEHLRKNKEELSSAELIQTPVELLKSIVLDKLANGKAKNADKVNASSKTASPVEEGGIYVIHDSQDQKDVKEVIDWLKKKGFKVHTPDFELQHYNLMIDHKQKMVKSDSVLIFCKHGNIQWSKTKIKDIIKAPGFGRTKPFQFKCLYIASEQNKDLATQVDESDFIIIENLESFSASLMSPIPSNS